MYRGRSQKYRQMRFSGACVMHTCESYRERRKTCELFRALTVVTTEKFTGNGESGKKARKRKYIYIKKTDSFSFLLPSKSTDSYQNSPGKNCMVGALSWIFLLILKERSGSSLPSLLMHSPASNDTPSMSSDTSRTFRTSTGATAKRQEHWVGMIMAWIFRYFSSQPSQPSLSDSKVTLLWCMLFTVIAHRHAQQCVLLPASSGRRLTWSKVMWENWKIYA